MAFVGSSIVNRANVNTTSTTINLPVPLTGTEYSQALPANCKGFILKTRGLATIQLAESTGLTDTTYITISGAASYEEINFYTSKTLYFEVDSSDIIEIKAYV